MNYHLALNPGSTSLGWAMTPPNRKALAEPCATVKAGVCIFSDGREPAAQGQIGAPTTVERRRSGGCAGHCRSI